MDNKSAKKVLFQDRRRLLEIIGVLFAITLLILLSRLEERLYQLSTSLSESSEFFISAIYFGIINLNVILILTLSFLIFRNIAKLMIDRNRGVFGSKLRTKLVVSFVLFAAAPTALMFYISYSFMNTSFETWFSSKIRTTMQQTREAGAQVYKQDQRRMESLARIALQRIRFNEQNRYTPVDLQQINTTALEGFEREYQLDSVKLYDTKGLLVWETTSQRGKASQKNTQTNTPASFVLDAISKFTQEPSLISKGLVEADNDKDVVKGIAPIYHQYKNSEHRELIGILVSEEHFETQILKSIETILGEFGNLRPGAQLIKLSYTVLLIVMVLVIIFASIWLGFYVAKGIIGPIQNLAEATREIALGNYDVTLDVITHDESGTLVKAFNKMTMDLQHHEEQTARFTDQLQITNQELERRRQYMEVILKNISAGVISTDSNNIVTSFNRSAEKLLNIKAGTTLYRDIRETLGEKLAQVLWNPIEAHTTNNRSAFSEQLDLQDITDSDVRLFVTASRVLDEHNEDRGVVIVFNDTTEQVRTQRMAAWREVARRIAHEIKNPITPIKLNAQRLLRRYKSKFDLEDQKIFDSCLETILLQVDTLRDLVNEFSKFSRLPTIHAKQENINTIIVDVANFYSISYPDVTFDTSEMEVNIPLINIDKEQMNRAIVNLVTNAIHAVSTNKDEKLIKFRTSFISNVNVIRIEVADNGVGIFYKDKSRVFEPYYSTKQEGTGLGLSIVHQIITDHAGYVRVSDYEDRGTLIIIELPLNNDLHK